MNLSEAIRLLRAFTAGYFGNSANVIYNNQSRISKMFDKALVVIGRTDTKRAVHKILDVTNPDEYARKYSVTVPITIDYFSHGKEYKVNEKTVAFEDDSEDVLLAFADYLNSDECIEWCFTNDVSLDFDGTVQNLTGIVNDNNYEFRSRLNLSLSFTEIENIKEEE